MSEEKPILVRAASMPLRRNAVFMPFWTSTAIIAACCATFSLFIVRGFMRERTPDVKVGHYGLVRAEREWDRPGNETVTVKVLNPDPIAGFAAGVRCDLPDDGTVRVVAVSRERWDVLLEYRGPVRPDRNAPWYRCPVGTLFRSFASQAEDMRINLRIHDFHQRRERALVEAYYLSAH